jgi:chitinase
MVMEFGATSPDFGDAIINTASAVLSQMQDIWPEKSSNELKSMLGLTPMLGRNFNGNVFQLAHATKVVDWAKSNNIGLLSFWSIERDNDKAGCAGTVSPYCSGVSQQRFDFTKIFQGFA